MQNKILVEEKWELLPTEVQLEVLRHVARSSPRTLLFFSATNHHNRQLALGCPVPIQMSADEEVEKPLKEITALRNAYEKEQQAKNKALVKAQYCYCPNTIKSSVIMCSGGWVAGAVVGETLVVTKTCGITGVFAVALPSIYGALTALVGGALSYVGLRFFDKCQQSYKEKINEIKNKSLKPPTLRL